jgi:FtsP/CotA-like multicopper oxidase with cupredoxin domain
MTRGSQSDHPVSRGAVLPPRLTLFLAAATLALQVGPAFAQKQPATNKQAEDSLRFFGRKVSGMRSMTNEQRKAAAARATERATAFTNRSLTVPQDCVHNLCFFGPAGNWGFTKPIQKFVDSLPGLGYENRNTLGNYIPLAIADTTTFPGSDYYKIEEVEYKQQMHSALGTTRLRGYLDMTAPENSTFSNGSLIHNGYLGPMIIAQSNRPVRVLIKNALPTTPNDKLFIPTDTTYMGMGPGPDWSPNNPSAMYTQNRMVVHLHGGNTPWISDGTPHQWITPAGDSAYYKKGESFANVPDMVGTASWPTRVGAAPIPNPTLSDGLATDYWTNQQSGRLMFYHDHSLGTTRLNVYVGAAAGYLIHDSVEDALINAGTIPGKGDGNYQWGIPLVIQDRTYVNPATINTTDPTWQTHAEWGQTDGSLWFPHVYMPNQWPDNPDLSGANPFGRWDWGPWFWPPQSTLTGARAGYWPAGLNRGAAVGAGNNPQPPATGSNVDYPCPGASLPNYVASSNCPVVPPVSGVPESFMDTPIVNGQAYPYLDVTQRAYRFRILNAANDRHWNLQIYYAADSTGAVCKGAGAAASCTEIKMVDAVPHPTLVTVTGAPNPSPLPACSTSSTTTDPVSGLPSISGTAPDCWPDTWPTDGRDGGVPDPTTAGPKMMQIGTEGGMMPQVADIPAQPVGYNYNRRDIVVLNVQDKALFMGPAERTDVIIDFSQVPTGSTLILYNDAPAPVPAFDTRFDFYTNDADQTDSGGAPTTAPGYGPNTRTIMQFRVTGPGGVTAFNETALKTALPAAFAASQNKPIVGQRAYASAYPTTLASLTAPGATDPFVRIQGTGLTYPDPGTGTVVTTPLTRKTIQELFTADYGRMNATLGTELALTNFLTQTTIPLGYIDPPSEVMNDSTVQIWKITHNGVDTHAIHFHLFDVQLINRVGWDGAIRPPDANEYGWKEVVRMNPLEDAIVAIRPLKQDLPWPIPTSTRRYDVTMPVGVSGNAANFTNLNPYTNLAMTVTNQVMDFGWEYVWHCHLLGHEENDMMRPVTFQVMASPTNLSVAQAGGPLKIAWAYAQYAGATAPLDLSMAAPQATGFLVQRANGSTAADIGAFSTIATINSLSTKTYTDSSVTGGNTYTYRILATNGTLTSPPSLMASGTANSVTAQPPAAPTNVTARSGITGGNRYITVSWYDPNSTNPSALSYIVQYQLGSGAWTQVSVPNTNIGNSGTRSTRITNSASTPVLPGTYHVQVQTVNGAGSSSFVSITGTVVVN